MIPSSQQEGIKISAPVNDLVAEILPPQALAFIGSLAREFNPRREQLLERRRAFQAAIDDGRLPDFLEETRQLRAADWKIAPVPPDLQDRRVEITGPVDRKMVINALNSGASTYVADFEDSHSPTWDGTLEGQLNLRDAVNGSIDFTSPEGKSYHLAQNPSTLIVRPLGLHFQLYQTLQKCPRLYFP